MNKQIGFTLIELVISIAILAVLAVFIIVTLDPFTQFEKSRDARRKSDLAQIQKALEQYYQDHEQYPPSTGFNNGVNSFEIIDTSTNYPPGTPIAWGTSTPVWQKYMEVIPKDPSYPSKTYLYVTAQNNQMYYVYASLDRGTKDPDACSGGICQNDPQGAHCGGSACNYGVSSPNTNP